MQEEVGGNSWQDYQRLVLFELKRLDKNLEILDSKVDKIREEDLSMLRGEIHLLKYKSTLWGGVAGSIPAIILLLLQLFGGN